MLIPKNGFSEITAAELPKARPIINEIGKAFERIIANRFSSWQIEHPESDFSGNQSGFRKNRSTCDAIIRFKNTTSTAVERGEYAIVVCLDIRNAFNSIPWRIIRRALRRKDFPSYIKRIIDSYLANRVI